MKMPEIRDASGLTLEVKVSRGFYVRKFIGLLLIRAACRVMRCGVHISED